MTRISDLLGDEPTFSFEFFPPADEAAYKQLETTLEELSKTVPSFVSVTCGAGGAGHDRTQELVVQICTSRQFPAMAHLTCVGHSRFEIAELLDSYAAAGVLNILALAGDPPDGSAVCGDFKYALELVELIRNHPVSFCVAVAAHPEVHPRSRDRVFDRKHLADKLNQADFAITQFFFDPADYVQLLNELADLGCYRPVIPGVMPVIWPKSIRRYASMNGSTVPEELFARLETLSVADRFKAAAEAAAELAQCLLDFGAPGIHLYTLNHPQASTQIARELFPKLGTRYL
ncbi:MAG: 5,10-methylenetetrahydrofolate reductase [Acidimicrobiia bacterium]|nr:5,10-methylenetetrahydrofolate reductase [Acidimicrobiia bacterium]MYC57745.1 5,10-methylenetetrahydrofolate reductase [Acidimicrobiia bacterium]MYG94726.1 5,10-methylenetetrahydrofolate reductase [Acidimicrobiia bacterium]MYI29740.1 5,10-methylenetetrahydrofolate reductase [Acidimicrobiia bacterium]